MSDLLFHGILGKGGVSMPPQEVLFNWVRPSGWPNIESLITPTDDKFVGLFAVPDNVDSIDGQPVAFSFSVAAAGTYSVDWGDGNTDTGIASGAFVGHIYDPANVNLTTTIYGYKVAIVQVTATNNITDFNLRPTGANINSVLPGTSDNLAFQGFTWLDMDMRLPNISVVWSLRFNSIRSVQKIRIRGGTNYLSTLAETFRNCFSLKEAVAEGSAPSVTTINSAFGACHTLVSAVLPDTPNCTNFSGMFQECFSLREVPEMNTASATNMNIAFSGCRIIKTIPLLNTSNVTNMSSMFSSCDNLETVPLIDTSSATNMSNMFQSCSSLRSVPQFNCSSATLLNGMFSLCPSLTEVPDLNTPVVTNTSSMFWNCFRLTKAPMLQTANVTTMQDMFLSCRSLLEVPLYQTNNVQIMTRMFSGCNSLIEIPQFNTSSVTQFGTSSTTGFAYQCFSLVRFPNLNLSSVTTTDNVRGMFRDCASLLEVPDLLIGTPAVGTSYGLNFAGLRSCTRIALKMWPNANIDLFDASNLGAEALAEIFTNLPTVTARTINVTYCRGRSTLSPAQILIATNKNWTVTN